MNLFASPRARAAALAAAAGLTSFAVLAGAVLAMSRARPEPPVYGPVADFALTDQAGRVVRAGDLRGDVWIADFIFTRCGGQCPLMTSRLGEIGRRVRGARLVSFTTDPAYDKPEVLKGYADRHGAGEDWLFLTGRKEALDGVARSFYMDAADEPMLHSVRFVLVDRDGRVRGFYDSEDRERLEALARDASTLL